MSKIKEVSLNIGLLWLRILMGCGIAYHGYGKIFGGKMDLFAEGVALLGFPHPEVFAWAAALSEFAGGICIVLGLFTRAAALFVLITMSVAAFVRHAPDPFSVKELALAYWTIAGALIFMGGGNFCIDSIVKRFRLYGSYQSQRQKRKGLDRTASASFEEEKMMTR